MDFIKEPQTIENKSMEIIANHLTGMELTEQAVKVYSRIIHASGEPDYAKIISIHPEAIAVGMQALKAGKPIYCDVEMVRTGINKRRLGEFGGEAFCLIADPWVAAKAKAEGITRSMAAMRAFAEKLDGAILAIGNAPTALFEVIKIMQESDVRPAMIVGVPVGFVGAAESKECLAQNSPVPYITVHGNKGGSPIAASIINAMLYMLEGR